jgi:hypothetical protein
MTPAELVDHADEIVHRPGAPTTPLYPRAAALLARQALELRVRQEWDPAESALGKTSMANQFHALRQLRSATVAATAYDTWAALSGACHQHPYDLTPTIAEIQGLVDAVRSLVTTDWA